MRADEIPQIKSAHDAMKAACEAYSEAVISALPLGTEVFLEWGDKVIGPYVVESVSDAWWSEPGRLFLRNPRTGNYKSASPVQIHIREGE